MSPEDDRPVFSTRSAEIGFALCTLAVGVLIMYGSWRHGIGWAEGAPDSGYFPFRIGALVVLASVINIVIGWRQRAAAALTFVSAQHLRRVLAVFVPTAVFVASLPWLGLYLGSAAFIAYFMRRHGNYGWRKAAATGVVVAVLAFFLFERWFQVPLAKGPLTWIFTAEGAPWTN